MLYIYIYILWLCCWWTARSCVFTVSDKTTTSAAVNNSHKRQPDFGYLGKCYSHGWEIFRLLIGPDWVVACVVRRNKIALWTLTASDKGFRIGDSLKGWSSRDGSSDSHALTRLMSGCSRYPGDTPAPCSTPFPQVTWLIHITEIRGIDFVKPHWILHNNVSIAF